MKNIENIYYLNNLKNAIIILSFAVSMIHQIHCLPRHRLVVRMCR